MKNKFTPYILIINKNKNILLSKNINNKNTNFRL